MIADEWEVAHVGIAVPDLQGAIALYETALGVAMSSIIPAPIDHLTTVPQGFRTACGSPSLSRVAAISAGRP